jgi:hypothetical protein
LPFLDVRTPDVPILLDVSIVREDLNATAVATHTTNCDGDDATGGYRCDAHLTVLRRTREGEVDTVVDVGSAILPVPRRDDDTAIGLLPDGDNHVIDAVNGRNGHEGNVTACVPFPIKIWRRHPHLRRLFCRLLRPLL